MYKSIQVLIVEDSPTQAEELRYLLEKQNYDVTVVNDGREALEFLTNYKPKLIISDILMPEMDGFELCRRIKSNINLKDIPVILLTILSDANDIIKGLQCGADNFLTKPYNEYFLNSCIQNIIINQKLKYNPNTEKGMEVYFGGKKHFLTLELRQTLDFLLSTYENAVQRNIELIEVQNELRILNEQLEEKVEQRTLALIKEIEERKAAKEKLKEEKDFADNLVQNSSVPTFVVDSQHNVIIWNKALEDLTNMRACEVIGTQNHWKAFYNKEQPSLVDLVIDSKYSCIPEGFIIYEKSRVTGGIHGEAWYENLGGLDRYLVIDASPIYNSKGELIAAIETIQDLTERKIVEEKQRQYNLRVQKELELAAKVQHELLPTREMQDIGGVSFAWDYKPCVYVAGDMFNIFPIDEEHLGFYMLDVMGHGMPAALKAVTLNYLLKPLPCYTKDLTKISRESSELLITPSKVFTDINERFTEEMKGINFVTIFYGILNKKNLNLTYARAGHYPPIIIRENGEVEQISQGGRAIGLTRDSKFEDYTVQLKSGDKIILYTDGITEAKNKMRKQYTTERLIKFLVDNRQLPISDLVKATILEVTNYIGDNTIGDDLTILGLEIPE